MKIVNRRPGAVTFLRKDAGLTQAELAARASLSSDYIFRIEKGKSVPSLGATWRICQALNITLHDMLNLAELAEELGPFIRLPNTINFPSLVEQVAYFNSEKTKSRYFRPDNFENRVKLYLAFREVVASYERQTEEYVKFGRAEYAEISSDELNNKSNLKLQLGEAFEAVRQLRDASTLQIVRETEVVQSVISKFENNLSDPAISAYDKLVRSLGLTPDELIYIAYPPQRRWPLFLPHNTYLNRYMVESYTAICLNFSQILDVRQRAELMVGYKAWLAEERKASTFTLNGIEVKVETPPVFERLKLRLLVLPGKVELLPLKLVN